MRRLLVAGLLALGTAVSAQVVLPTGAGVTVNDPGSVRTGYYSVTVNPITAFVANATTADVTLGTIPPKMRIRGLVLDLTQAFTCAAVCTSAQLTMTCGKSAGGNEYIVSFNVNTGGALQKGLVDADYGTALIRATNISGGDLPSWASATTLQCRLTSGTGNIGNGTVSNLNAGAFTVKFQYEWLP